MGITGRSDSSRSLGTPQPSSPADALFSATQRRVLGLLFGQPERSFFATEIIGLVEGGSGAVQRELVRLAASGLLMVTRLGNRKHYQANPASAVHAELCSLIRKTVVLPGTLAAALEPARIGIDLALVYGPVAGGQDAGDDGIDLLLVSDTLTLDAAGALLKEAETQLGRRINTSLYTAGEFRLRTGRPNTFLARVLAGETMVIVGALPG